LGSKLFAIEVVKYYKCCSALSDKPEALGTDMSEERARMDSKAHLHKAF